MAEVEGNENDRPRATGGGKGGLFLTHVPPPTSGADNATGCGGGDTEPALLATTILAGATS